MRVLIINIDSKKMPNLALEKIKLYHISNGDDVYFDLPILANAVDKIYVSCVFTENRQSALDWQVYNAEIGGSGVDIEKKLPDYIESITPRINFGFVTRGCNRNCAFCIVTKKEGNVHKVADIDDIWDGKSKNITLLDNNILFDKQTFFETVKFAITKNISIDFNQGLDFRLLDDDVCTILKKMRHKEYRFAFDDPQYLPGVEVAIKLLNKHSLNRSIWYVLVGFNSTFEEDLSRLEYLKKMDQRPFVMRYESVKHDPKYILLARWVNQRQMFMKKTFEQFSKMR
jgi:hypothetical protein